MNITDVQQKMSGNIVPIPGQFNDDLTLNLSGYTKHVEYLYAHGIRCFYLALSASEFDRMTRKERVEVTRTVAQALPSDAIVLAQAVGGNHVEEQAEEGRMMVDAGADAVVFAPVGIKEGNKFFSSFYERASYAPPRHDEYFVEYVEQFAQLVGAPLVYHDKPFKSGKGPGMALLERIVSIDLVIGLKEHVPDPLTLQRVYSTFGDRVACYDGFGKTLQFWSMQWGASGRHTCWSWFDPDSDMRFVQALNSGDLTTAAAQVNREWPLAEAICMTGFAGYKYCMHLVGLPGGPCRIPGERLDAAQKKCLENACRQLGIID